MAMRDRLRELSFVGLAALFLTFLFAPGRRLDATLLAFSVLIAVVVGAFLLGLHLLRFLLTGRLFRSEKESVWFSVGCGAAILSVVSWLMLERELLHRPWFLNSPAKRAAAPIVASVLALLLSWQFFGRSRPVIGGLVFVSMVAFTFLPEAFLYPLPETRWLLLVGFAFGSVLAARIGGLRWALALVGLTGGLSYLSDGRSEHVLKTTLLDVWPREASTHLVDEAAVRDARKLFGRRSEEAVLRRLPAPAIREQWNLLWVTLCTSRADHFGFLGSPLALTPAMDRLAERGVIFERAYSPAPASAGSIAAMFRGWYPPQCPEVDGVEADATWLPTLLARKGLSSEACTSFGLLALRPPFRSLLRGFEDHGPKQWFGRIAAPDVVAAFAQSLDTGREKPWFRWIFLMDAHAPYHGDPLASEQPTSQEARYAAGLRVLDRAVEALWNQVEQSGQAHRTVLIVHGDHGEALGEHGIMGHATGIHDAQIRVPLFLRMPEGTPRRVAAPVDLVDLAPTVHEIFALPGDAGGPGDSLLPWLLGDDLPSVAVSTYRVPGAPSAARSVMVGGDRRKTVLHDRSEFAEVFDLARDIAESAPESNSARARDDARLLRVVLEDAADHFLVRNATEDVLLSMRTDEDAGTETAVALDLLRSPHASDVAALIPALQVVLQEAPQDVLPLLPGLLTHRDAAVRARTIEALPASLLGRCGNQVREALGDPEERVRLAALAAIVRAPRGRQPGDLRNLIPATPVERRAKAVALSALGDHQDLHALLSDTAPSGEEQLEAWFAAVRFGEGRAHAFCEGLARDVEAPVLLRLQAYLSLLRAGLAGPIECAIELQSKIPEEMVTSAANERDPSGGMPLELLLQFALGENRSVALHALKRMDLQLQKSRSGISARSLIQAWFDRSESEAKRLLMEAGFHPRFSSAGVKGVASAKILEWVGPQVDPLTSSYAKVEVTVGEPGALHAQWHDPVTGREFEACVLWLPTGTHALGLPAQGVRDQEVLARLQIMLRP